MEATAARRGDDGVELLANVGVLDRRDRIEDELASRAVAHVVDAIEEYAERAIGVEPKVGGEVEVGIEAVLDGGLDLRHLEHLLGAGGAEAAEPRLLPQQRVLDGHQAPPRVLCVGHAHQLLGVVEEEQPKIE